MWTTISGEEMWNSNSESSENKGYHWDYPKYVLGQKLGLKRKFLGSVKSLKKDKKFKESFDSLLNGFFESNSYDNNYHNCYHAYYNGERIKGYKTEYIGDGILRFYKGKYTHVLSYEKREFTLSLSDLIFKGDDLDDLSIKYLDLSSYQKVYDLLVEGDEMTERVED